MTVAICLQCGARKLGAWTPCSTCGFLPEDEDDLARSLLLSDHNLDGASLEEAAERIKAGETVAFEREAIERTLAVIRANPDAVKMPIGCHIAVWTPVVVMLLLLVVLIGLVVWTRLIVR